MLEGIIFKLYIKQVISITNAITIGNKITQQNSIN